MPQGSRITAEQHELTHLALLVIRERQADMSNVELARRAEVSRPMLVSFYSGTKVPTVNEFMRLCSALEVVPSEVVREAERRRDGGNVVKLPTKPGLSVAPSTVEYEQQERADDLGTPKPPTEDDYGLAAKIAPRERAFGDQSE